MKQIFNIAVLGIIVFLLRNHIDFDTSAFGSNNYSYRETIINVYEISDDIISESQRVEYYQSISANYEYSGYSTSSGTILDNITFVED